MVTASALNGIDDLLAKEGADVVLSRLAKAKRCRAPRRLPENPVGNGSTPGEIDLWQFKHTDFGFAERFTLLHGPNIRFCHPWAQWLIYDESEGRWRVDQTARILQLVKETTRAMFLSAANLEGSARDAGLAFSKECEKTNKIINMLRLAASEDTIPVLPTDLDADNYALNVQNGTLDLRTATLRPHRREDLITKLCPVKYEPSATCPTWLDFQERVTAGRPDLIRFKQNFTGYALTGEASEKRSLAILYGAGNNGKTTELELLRFLLGDYAGQIRIESLMEQKNRSGSGPSPDIADLRGFRLVVSSEPGEGQRLAENTVKYLTSMGTIKARHLNRENFEFQQTWKIFMDCNHKPVIKGTDSAIWNRIGLVPFDVVIPDEEIDRDLPAKLRQELSGVLSWAVQGCLNWQKEGLCVPDVVREATLAYRADMDVIGRFIEECCVLVPNARAKAKDLYTNYEKWCKESGETALNMMNFGTRLSERGFAKDRDYKGVSYAGIGIKVDSRS